MSDATAVQAMQRYLSECEVARRALVERALKLERALLEVAPMARVWVESHGTADDKRKVDAAEAVLLEVSL